MNTAVYLLRAFQLGLSVDDMKQLTVGMVFDMIIESNNDNCEYDVQATQEDFMRF